MAALYFAVATDRPGNAAVFALNPKALNQRQFGHRAIMDPRSEQIRPFLHPAFGDHPEPDAEAAALIVDETDRRMLAQLSGCTIHTSSREAREQGPSGGGAGRREPVSAVLGAMTG